MKVTSAEYLDQLQKGGQTRNQAELRQDQGFSKLMEDQKTAPNNTQATETGGPTATRLLESSSLVGMIMAGQKIGESGPPAEKQLESALDKIEQYASALGDSSKTLKDIEPLASDLKKTAGELSELSRNLAEGDPLKSISNETAILATVEAMKFRRGDYI